MEISNAANSTSHYKQQNQITTRNRDELSPVEKENIQLFSTLMERVQAASGDISKDLQINKLYTQIGTLQPKLVKNLDETNRKHRKYNLKRWYVLDRQLILFLLQVSLSICTKK